MCGCPSTGAVPPRTDDDDAVAVDPAVADELPAQRLDPAELARAPDVRALRHREFGLTHGHGAAVVGDTCLLLGAVRGFSSASRLIRVPVRLTGSSTSAACPASGRTWARVPGAAVRGRRRASGRTEADRMSSSGAGPGSMGGPRERRVTGSVARSGRASCRAARDRSRSGRGPRQRVKGLPAHHRPCSTGEVARCCRRRSPSAIGVGPGRRDAEKRGEGRWFRPPEWDARSSPPVTVTRAGDGPSRPVRADRREKERGGTAAAVGIGAPEGRGPRARRGRVSRPSSPSRSPWRGPRAAGRTCHTTGSARDCGR